MFSRRILLILFSSALVGRASGFTAYSVPATDLVQVTADPTRISIVPASGSEERPVSEYCNGKPDWCSMKHVRDIHNPQAISVLQGFVDQRLDGWSETGDSPIPDVEINFIRNGTIVGTFGSGPNFFVRGGGPEQVVRKARDSEISEFHRLAHIA